MIIDSLTDRSSINIETLGFESPERKRRFFDVNKEVGEAEWRELEKERKSYAETPPSWDQFTRISFAMSLVAPGRRADLRVGDADWERVRFWIQHMGAISWAIIDNRHFLRLITAFPERVTDLRLADEQLTTVKERIIKKIEDARLPINFDSAYEVLTALALGRTLFAKDNLNLEISRDSWAGIVQALKERIHFDLAENVRVDPTYFSLESLALLRLVYPDWSEQFLDQEIKMKLQRFLDKSRKQKRWLDFAICAAAGEVSVADVARITPDGRVEIVLEKKDLTMTEKIPTMPIKRAF